LGGAKVSDRSESLLGCGAAILFLGFGLLQLAAGWAGIEDSFGWWWGVAAAAVAILFRFTLPIAIGAYLGATNIWGWHWFFAALFAAPGLLFMVPWIVAALLDAIRR
jgi:hypothetical protein